MSALTETIAGRTVEFNTQSGGNPKKLFLGRSEWEEMRLLAYQEARLVFRNHSSRHERPEYRGMKIYQVDDENYVAVGE